MKVEGSDRLIREVIAALRRESIEVICLAPPPAHAGQSYEPLTHKQKLAVNEHRRRYQGVMSTGRAAVDALLDLITEKLKP